MKTTVDSACGSDIEFQRITSDLGLDSEMDKKAFRDEMLSVKSTLSVLDKKVERLVTNVPHMLIKYLPLRDFWLDSFGTTQIVNVELFCNALDGYLKNLPVIGTFLTLPTHPINTYTLTTLTLMNIP